MPVSSQKFVQSCQEIRNCLLHLVVLPGLKTFDSFWICICLACFPLDSGNPSSSLVPVLDTVWMHRLKWALSCSLPYFYAACQNPLSVLAVLYIEIILSPIFLCSISRNYHHPFAAVIHWDACWVLTPILFMLPKSCHSYTLYNIPTFQEIACHAADSLILITLTAPHHAWFAAILHSLPRKFMNPREPQRKHQLSKTLAPVTATLKFPISYWCTESVLYYFMK